MAFMTIVFVAIVAQSASQMWPWPWGSPTQIVARTAPLCPMTRLWLVCGESEAAMEQEVLPLRY